MWKSEQIISGIRMKEYYLEMFVNQEPVYCTVFTDSSVLMFIHVLTSEIVLSNLSSVSRVRFHYCLESISVNHRYWDFY